MPDYEKIGLGTDEEVQAMLAGIDVGRFLPYFYKGHTGGQQLNPNETYGELRNRLNKSGVPQEDIDKTIDVYRRNEREKRINATEEDIRLPLASVVYGVKEQFKKQIGRDATQEEIAAVMNDITPEEIGSTVNVNSIDKDAGGFGKSIAKQYGLNDKLTELSPKFRLVDQANLQLQNIGETLPQDIVSKLLAGDTNPEDAEVLSNTYIQTARERKYQESIPQLAQEEQTAINQFETGLQESQTRFLNESIVPNIIKQLNARGLATGGDLAASIAEASGGLQREIQGQVAPLRAQSSLGAIQAKGQNILRGALESGQSLSSAMEFARNLLSQDRQNQFTAGENDINRAFQQELFNQQQAIQLALGNASGGWASGLDYFLQYGLPALSSIGAAFIPGGIAAKIAASTAAGAGGSFLGQTLTSQGAGGLRSSGFTPRRYSDYAGNWNPKARGY